MTESITDITFFVKLEAKQTDSSGYITYVFSRIDYTDEFEKYIACIQFPNWNQGIINVGDQGFVTVRPVRAGIDTWYDGKGFTPYKYTNIIFMKFIRERNEEVTMDIQLD